MDLDQEHGPSGWEGSALGNDPDFRLCWGLKGERMLGCGMGRCPRCMPELPSPLRCACWSLAPRCSQDTCCLCFDASLSIHSSSAVGTASWPCRGGCGFRGALSDSGCGDVFGIHCQSVARTCHALGWRLPGRMCALQRAALPRLPLRGRQLSLCCACWCINRPVVFVARHVWKGCQRCAPKHMHSGVLVCLAKAASEANRPSCPGQAAPSPLAVTAVVPPAAWVWTGCAGVPLFDTWVGMGRGSAAAAGTPEAPLGQLLCYPGKGSRQSQLALLGRLLAWGRLG